MSIIPANYSKDEEYEEILGEKIANGTTREVFWLDGSADYVLKKCYETSASKSANEREAIFFDSAKAVGVDKYLGTVHSISKSGKYLVMELLLDIVEDDFEVIFPEEITDNQKKNFGKNSEGEIKMRDFALQNSPVAGGNTKKRSFSSKALDENKKLLEKLKNLE